MKTFICCIAILVAGFALTTSITGQKTTELFEIVGERAFVDDPSSIASVRETEIRINAGISGRKINILLPEGKTYEAVDSGSELRAMDDRTWRGKIVEGEFEGDVVITIRKGFVSGIIYTPDKVYEIVPRGKSHYLVELDQSRFPECGGEITDRKQDLSAFSPEGAVVDSGDRIDVLVVYTTATKNVLGGDAQAQTLAQQAIDSSNTAYLNSRIRQRLRLVNSQEIVYTESGNASTDLSNLRNNATIQGLRNTYSADLVAQIEEVSSVCGIGYLMGGSGGNQNNGFTVTARSCAVGNLSFAHELGHNMGSQHNPENGSGATFAYGYGHYVNGSFRTVMSYVDPCPNGCTRRPYFSNPRVTFMGFPTGIDDARDNARSINNTADVIANYRYSGSSLTLNSLNSGGVIPRNVPQTVNWTSNGVSGNVNIELSRDAGATWQVLLSNTANDGTETITFPAPSTRRARLRLKSVAAPAVTDTSLVNFRLR